MTTVESRLGLTNILKRLAYAYLTKGFGRHQITHDVYDEVDVSELYPWVPNPTCAEEHGAGIKVTFLRNGKKVRWVEFSVRDVGGGGDPTIFSIK
jgi:hypothetical protein